MRRGHSVRAYVVRLVVAIALPLLVFGAFLLIRSADNEQLAIATTARERALGAAADLDRELRHLQDLVSILADSDNLFVSDTAVSRHHAISMLRDPTLGLAVRSLSGEPLFNTCTADVGPYPVNGGIADVLYEAGSAKSHISELLTGPRTGEPLLTIDLPVRRGESVLIVSLCVLPRILQILTEQHLPNGWTAAVVDNQARTIASIRETAGESFSVAGSDRNVVSIPDNNPITAHGGSFDPGYVASSPVHLAGWTVAVSVPREIFSGPVRRAVLVLFVAGGGTLALMLALAVTIGRRIAGSLTGLTAIARSMGQGGRPTPACTGINEADLIAEVLCSTGEDLNRRTEQLTQTVAALRDREKQLRNLSDDLRRALDERTALLNRLVSAQECERQRIARELHDHLGQYFAAMLLGLSAPIRRAVAKS
jgi:signal transduction histidine kinase